MKQGPKLNGNKTSASVIKGLVKDHSLLADYTLPQVQPFHSKEWRHYMRTMMKRAFYLKPETHAVFYMSGFMILITGGLFFIKRFLMNQKAVVLMRHGNAKVKGMQWFTHDYNLNADDYFDNVHACWRSDPLCGLVTAPKRPWQSLKNPESVLWRLNWDMKKNPHRVAGDGYY